MRLTTSAAVDDGPEYTPDGKFIYFNSASGGLMQIWRMSADGSNQEAVASDEFFDYFESLRGRRRTTIVVDQGDTWERVARRLKLTVGQLERINQRSHLEKLVPKQTLVVYAPVGRALQHEAKLAAASPLPARQSIVAPRPDDLPPLPESAAVAEPSASSR